MSNLLHLFRLTTDAAASAKAGVQLATENLVGSRDPGYVKRTSEVRAEMVGGRLAGIHTGAPTRLVDEKIVSALRSQSSSHEYNMVHREIIELIDDLNGDLDSDASMDRRLVDFSQKAAALTVEAGSPILRRNAVESLKTLLRTVRTFADGVGAQRNSAETGIVTSISQVNTLAKELARLNEEISTAASVSQDISNLETRREEVVGKISKLMDVEVVKSAENIYIYTRSSHPIVETHAYEISYKSSGRIDYTAEYPTNLNHIKILDSLGVERNITGDIKDGAIGGYLHVRDVVCPNYQKAIDNFVKTLEAKINKVHNKGTGFPPADKLTGRRLIAADKMGVAMDWKADSVLRIGLMDPTGKFAVSNGISHLDLNLNPGGAGGLTPLQLRDQINAAFGAEIVSFSEDSAGSPFGKMIFKAPDGLRIALGDVDGQTPAELDSGEGFSEYFKLNDLIVSSPDEEGRGYANTLGLRQDIEHNISLFSIGKLNPRSDAAVTGTMEQIVGVASGDGTNLLDFRSILESPTINFQAAGSMGEQTSSFNSYLATFVNLINLDASAAIQNAEFSENVLDGLQRRHSMISGVNQDDEIGEVMMQKIFYKGVLSTSQHLMEMMEEMLKLFST